MPQLPADCLNEIFECLDNYKDVRSCLLVNRLWCEVAVRIFWRQNRSCSTLIACLPNESKEILYKNGIIIPPPTLKPPMFNYAAFCKYISSETLWYMIKCLIEKFLPQSLLNKNICIIAQEILKMLMNQISSLRKLETIDFQNITFVTYPGANNCLSNLSKLTCCSMEYYPGFFNQLSQICHNIKSLDITYEDKISNGLVDLILSQKNIKYLYLRQHEKSYVVIDIIPLLTKLPNTLIKLKIENLFHHLPPIAGFTNLHKLELSFYQRNFFGIYEDGFSKLQHLILPQLQVFRFITDSVGLDKLTDFLIGFIMNNGKNLKELYVDGAKRINLTIAESCPNLKMLTTYIFHEDLDNFIKIFNNCQHLESLTVIYDDEYLDENELLKIITGYSPKNFHELTLNNQKYVESILLPEKLESFFISWANRVPQKSLSLLLESAENNLAENDENMEIIEKYIKLGVIKKFNIRLQYY